MRTRFLLPFLTLNASLTVFAAEPTPTQLMQVSPFVPLPGTMAAPTGQPADVLEFAGVSVEQPKTLVNLFDTKEKRSRWIPVGSKLDGIEVVSYDAGHEQVVIRRGADLKVLHLRRPGKVTGSPAFSPAMAAATVTQAPIVTAAAAAVATPAPASNEPKKPLTVAQQEEEARMFVADMLDIGMQHRKAYEEAQKKAAAEKASGVTPTPAPASPPPTVTPSGG